MNNYSLSDTLELIMRFDPDTKRRPVRNFSALGAVELIAMLEYKAIVIQRVSDKNPPQWLPAAQQTMFDKGIVIANESVSPESAHQEIYEFIRSQTKPRTIDWYLSKLPVRSRLLEEGLVQSHRRWLSYRTTLTEKGIEIVKQAKSELDTFFGTDGADLSKVSNQSCLIMALLVKSYTWDKVYGGLYAAKTKKQRLAAQEKITLVVDKARVKGDTNNSLELILNALSLVNAESSTQ